jgi:hypothetical protein
MGNSGAAGGVFMPSADYNFTGAVTFDSPPSITTGVLLTKIVNFVETAAGTLHAGTVPIPAGAVLHDIMVSNDVYWAATGAVSLTVGDTADADGYFVATDLKATDMVPGEVYSIRGGTAAWGGKNGAYLVSATGRSGPASTNFGFHYVAASNIVIAITVATPAATAGRTSVSVVYSVPTVIAPVVT